MRTRAFRIHGAAQAMKMARILFMVEFRAFTVMIYPLLDRLL